MEDRPVQPAARPRGDVRGHQVRQDGRGARARVAVRLGGIQGPAAEVPTLRVKGIAMMRKLWAGALVLAVAGGMRAADAGTTVDLGGLKSSAPAGWKKEEPTEIQRQFRQYQFKIPKE